MRPIVCRFCPKESILKFSSICWRCVREEIKRILEIRFERAQKNEDCRSSVQTGPEPSLPAAGVPQRQSQSPLELRLIAKTFFTGKTPQHLRPFWLLNFKHCNTKQVSFEICNQPCNNPSAPLIQVQASVVI